MKKLIILLAAIFILLSCSSEDNPVNNNPTPVNNYLKIRDIMYECKIGDETKLYSMTSVGSEKEVIPIDIENPTQPRFSPDNSMISFFTIENGKKYLQYCSADTNDITSFSLFNIHSYSWLYDNSKIAASIQDPSSEEYIIILIDTDKNNEMTYLIEGGCPKCSPVDKDIIYYKNIGLFNDQLNIIRSDGSGMKTLVNSSIVSYTWSADGEKVIYSTSDEEIFIINKDGTGKREICRNDKQSILRGDKLLCSPNNDYILFRGYEISYFGDLEKEILYKINLDGSGKKEILSSTKGIQNVVISPDGSEIAYSIADSEDGVIYIYNVEYTNKTIISDPGVYSVLGDWK
jgi:Tol biopolymer transport system component